MSRCIFGFPNHGDVATLSGGSWQGALPLANLQDRRSSRIARSVDALRASTQLDADLGSDGRAVRVAALPWCTNLTRAALWRIRGSRYADFGASLNLVNPDLLIWTNNGALVRTGGQDDPLGGTDAYLLTDDSTTVMQNIADTPTFASDGTKVVRIDLKAGTASTTSVALWDATVSIYRHQVSVTWTDGVPTVSTASGSGNITVTDLGGGWYRIEFTVEGVIAANTNRAILYPASGAAANTGSVYAHGPWVQDASSAYVLEYESGWLDVYPVIYPVGVLDVDDPGYFDGKLTQEQWDAGYRIDPVHVLSSITNARYWRIEIDDEANVAGYIDVGRLVLAHGYQPTINFQEGAQLGVSSDSTRQTTDGGATYHRERPVRRRMDGTIPKISEDEAMVRLFEMDRLLNTTTQFYFVFSSSDTFHMHRRSFIATLEELTLLQIPTASWWDKPVRILEEL